MVSGVYFSCLGTGKAESIPKPSIPDFTTAYIDKSYDIPPTTTTDPYNGQTITAPGSHVKASAIEIRIKNEAFTPSTTESGNKVGYYYNIRWKGHFETNWHYAFKANYGSGYFPRSDGAETVFSSDGQYTCGFDKPNAADFRVGDQIDFQVEAMIGYVMDPGPFDAEVFEGQVSGWSSTQTLTITGTSASPSPTVPEYPFLSVFPLLGGIFVVVAVVVRKKKVLT
jgi:hypothetical protein